jgi:hypothetical protein
MGRTTEGNLLCLGKMQTIVIVKLLKEKIQHCLTVYDDGDVGDTL